MKVGIFGGSFNSPHEMHKNIALSLINNKLLDEVIFVPTGNKYIKKDLIDAKYRLDMLKILINNNNNLKVSDYELKNTQIYTYQTLDYFNNNYDEVYLIIGSDNYNDIKKWKNYNYIINNYNIIVINRGDDCIKPNKNIKILNIDRNNISSTKIRDNIKDYKLNDEILEYIKEKKLYNI